MFLYLIKKVYIYSCLLIWKGIAVSKLFEDAELCLVLLIVLNFIYDYFKIKHFILLKWIMIISYSCLFGLEIVFLCNNHKSGLSLLFCIVISLPYFLRKYKRDKQRKCLFSKLNNSIFGCMLCYGLSNVPDEKIREVEDVLKIIFPVSDKRSFMNWIYLEYKGDYIDTKMIFWSKFDWVKYCELTDTKEYTYYEKSGSVTVEYLCFF